MENKTQQSTDIEDSNPVSNPKSSQTPQPKKKSKLVYVFLALFVLLVLTIGATGAVYISKSLKPEPTPTPSKILEASPTPNPTASWKTVTFDNLTFKIPPSYQSGYLGSTSLLTIDPQAIPTTPQYGEFTPAFSIELIKNKTLDQVKQEFLNQQGYTNKETSVITTNGIHGLRTSKVLPPGQDVKNHNVLDVYLPVGQDLYHFSSFDLHISTPEQQKYFDQILSTFTFAPLSASTFTSPTPSTSQTIDTSNWKTYTDTKFGYSVQFPSNWEEGSLGSEDGKVFDYTMVTHGPSDVRMQEVGIYASITDTPALANSFFETMTKKYSASQLHPIIIDGVQGLSGDNVDDRWAQKGEITQDIFLVKGSIFYLISIGKMDKNLNTTDLILSTFKFTQ